MGDGVGDVLALISSGRLTVVYFILSSHSPNIYKVLGNNKSVIK